MVGNDVVDLSDSEVLEGPAHPRFDARVFDASELEALRTSDAPDRLRWQLWAAKEAAYKLARKADPEVVFSPRTFVVSLDGSGVGEVVHFDELYAVRICAAGDAVHAIATLPGAATDRIVAGVATTEAPLDASREVRELAAVALAAHLDVPTQAIRIARRGRIPTLAVEGREAGIDLSLSHHGRYLAFACDLGGGA